MSDFGDKVKYFFGVDAVEDDQKRDLDFDDLPEEKDVTSRTRPTSTVSRDDFSRPAYTGSRSSNRAAAIPKPQPKIEKPDQRMIICKYSPVAYAEATDIIDDIKKGNPVIINFESTDDLITAKIINICEGAAYALEADLTKIATSIFIVVPKGIDILNNISSRQSTQKDMLG